MELARRMDPQLWAVFEKSPPIKSVIEDIAVLRRTMAEMLARVAGARTRTEQVSVRDLTIPGPTRAPGVPVRIYTPAHRADTRSAMLWIHGGGFTAGLLDQDDLLCERIAEQVGCVVVSVEYRLAPEHPFPDAPEDCYAALRWIGASAQQLGIDADRIAVGGESAGGGLAAGVGIMARDRGEINLAFQLLLCPCLDDRHLTPSSHEITDDRTWNRAKSIECWRAYLGAAWQKEVSPYAAPARLRDCSGLPPTYLMVGELDLMRDEVMDYAAKLLRAGVSTELHVWPGAFHGFEVLVPDAAISRQAVTDYLAALRRPMPGRAVDQAVDRPPDQVT